MRYLIGAILIAFNCLASDFFIVEQSGHGIKISAPDELNADFKISPQRLSETLQYINENIFNFQQTAWPHFYLFSNSLPELIIPSSNSLMHEYHNLYDALMNGMKHQPLFLCSECGTHNKAKGPCMDLCPLKRLEDKASCPREKFLQEILAQEILPQQGVIFYGSGGNLFELQTLAAFINKGAPIDKVYFIEPDNRFTFEDMMRFQSDFAHKKFLEPSDPNIFRRLARTLQLSYFIWALNPAIKIYFYTNYKSYLSDLKSDITFQVDALIAMDPIDRDYHVITGEFIHALTIKKELHILKNNLSPNSLYAVIHRCSALLSTVDKEIMMHERRCGACQKPKAESKCSLCRSEFYCDRACQTSHWAEHKKACFRL